MFFIIDLGFQEIALLYTWNYYKYIICIPSILRIVIYECIECTRNDSRLNETDKRNDSSLNKTDKLLIYMGCSWNSFLLLWFLFVCFCFAFAHLVVCTNCSESLDQQCLWCFQPSLCRSMEWEIVSLGSNCWTREHWTYSYSQEENSPGLQRG